MRLRVLAIVSFCVCLSQTPQSLWAQPFDAPPTTPPGPATDTTQSLGQFILVLNPSISGAFVGVPGYTASTNTFTSPLLYDPSTQINRSSGSLTLGNGVSVTAPVGSPGGPTVTSNSGDTALTFSGNMNPLLAGLTYPVPSGSGATAPNTNAVFTQINSFDLTNGMGFSVTTGTAAMDPNLPASVGQVTSNSSTGGFPARSFFDVFVDIDTPLPPALGGGTVSLTNATVYSGTTAVSAPGMPLMIANSGITSFPPVVIYTHGNSTAVPIYDESPGPLLGDPIGLLILAGHGAGYGQSSGSGSTGAGTDQNTGMPADQTTFENTIMSDYMAGDTLPVPPQYADWLTPYTPDRVAPEPSSIVLLAGLSGGAVVVWYRRRRRARRGEFSATKAG